MRIYKRYVDVIVKWDAEGKITPLYIYWQDGQIFQIDRIKSVVKKASPLGGCGICYTCMIHGNERNLYFEREKQWFVESYKP